MTESRYQRTNPADSLGQMVSVTLPAPGGSGTRPVYKTAYDLAGKVRVTTFDYDVLGRIESILAPALL